LLLEGEKTVNEAFREAQELQVVLVAARPQKNYAKTHRGNRFSPNRRKDRIDGIQYRIRLRTQNKEGSEEDRY
jgi:hypothetical protein